MPLQNRVTPYGELIATPARGTLMGNRGCLHDSQQRLMQRRWTMYSWVTCVLSFKCRRRALMQPHRYTELFFLDEATALAAGHRPCGECRRADYQRFMASFRLGNAMPGADRHAVDRVMQADRVVSGTRRQRHHQTAVEHLPDGAMIARNDQVLLLWGDALYPWHDSGYGPAERKERGIVTVLTPRSTIEAMRAGYRAAPHPGLSP